MLELERDEITSRTYRQPEWKIYYDDGTPVSEDEHPVTRVLRDKRTRLRLRTLDRPPERNRTLAVEQFGTCIE